MRLMLVMFTMLVLMACTEARYLKEGKTLKQAEQDLFACENQILVENKGSRNLSDKQIDRLMGECMKSKGYTTNP